MIIWFEAICRAIKEWVYRILFKIFDGIWGWMYDTTERLWDIREKFVN